MVDILTDDVQTYIRKMISKEFEVLNNEDKTPSGNRKSNNNEHWNQPDRPVGNCSSGGQIKTNGV